MTTVKATKALTANEVKENKIPGQFAWWFVGPEPRMIFCCPSGCGDISNIPVSEREERPAGSWGWDGNLDAPTLTPSLHQLTCGWHGYLKAGVWESV